MLSSCLYSSERKPGLTRGAAGKLPAAHPIVKEYLPSRFVGGFPGSWRKCGTNGVKNDCGAPRPAANKREALFAVTNMGRTSTVPLI